MKKVKLSKRILQREFLGNCLLTIEQTEMVTALTQQASCLTNNFDVRNYVILNADGCHNS